MFKLREMFMKKVSGERVGQVLEFWERNVIPALSDAASQLLHGPTSARSYCSFQ